MAGDEQPPRERPWLLPCNRKLRHLQGITLRNLTLATPHTRARTRTIDDDALPSTLKSPTKALALRESKGLAHSRSSGDLTATGGDELRGNGSISHGASAGKRPQRPNVGKGLRRRSTMEWQGATPQVRQKKLEDITDSRMADTFFSLHVDELDEPVYISEVVEKAMNPNFRFFDLASCGPGVTRMDSLSVRLWAKNESTKGWQFLVDLTVQLTALQFIGKTLGKFRHPLPQNCILFHMTDGIYTSFTDLPVKERARGDMLAPPKENPDGRVLTSSTYDALMRLATLDDCIQDALNTRDRLAEEIEDILEKNREPIVTIEQVPEAQERLKTVESAVATERRRVEAVRKRRDDLEANIQYRRDLMRAGQELQGQVEKETAEQKEKHDETKGLVTTTEEDITGQRRRVCEDLLKIFPIEPIPGKSLQFTIRGLPLPNGDFEDVKEDVTAAALGYVAHLVWLLSLYLAVILPYPVSFQGSTSTINDPLSMSTGPQPNPPIYPLFMKGVVRFRFEYGVFLLNKNIEILSNSLGLRPPEPRHTLPNLKYLLFVATAGEGELPARKAGGIKALLRREGALSRKTSTDSTATGSSIGIPDTRNHAAEDALKKLDHANTNGKTVSAKTAVHFQKTGGIPRSKLRDMGQGLFDDR